MDYYETQQAVVNIGHELRRRGWKLFDYKEDRSDGMIDYFEPASWAGVATHDAHPGIVVGVHVSAFHAPKSGRPEVHIRYIPDEERPCPQCNGTGIQPDSLTFEEAKANPLGQHASVDARQHGRMNMLAGVVSPLNYHDNGQPRCTLCQGRGHPLKREDYVAFTWPVFHVTPKGKAWHVEHNGKIVATGTGLSACVGYTPNAANVKATVDKIEAAVAKAEGNGPTPRAPKPTGTGSYTVRYDRNWTWIKFDSKPDDAVLTKLKALGGNFSRKRLAWYFTYRLDDESISQAIAC